MKKREAHRIAAAERTGSPVAKALKPVLQWHRRHLGAKLLLLIFLIAVVPYAAILVYSHLSEERLYTEHFLKEQQDQMRQVSRNVQTHFAQLYRELAFLSGSAVMEDILVDDPGGRIASLLERYKAVYDIDIELLAIGVSGRVIASTGASQKGGPYRHYRAFEAGVGHPNPVAAGDTLLLQMPVYSGMGKERIVGYLLMEYRLDNMRRFNFKSRLAETVLFSPESSRYIGTLMPPFPAAEPKGIYETEDAIWLYGSLAEPLPGWYVGYRIDRAEQRMEMQDLNRFLVLMLLFGVGAIAVAAYWFSRRIVAPIGALQRRASEMVRTGRYEHTVSVERDDEIGQLATAFNALADDIQKAFAALRRENFIRVKRLTQMIGLFNRLMETEEESACLKTALGQLKTLAPEYDVRFSRYSGEHKMPSLYVYDFDHETLKYYGSLIIPEGLAEEEQAFFRAIASMIAARIEQIRAFNRLHRDAAAKTAFISHLSHDLRTPLHAILSQTQFLIGYGKLDEADMERVGGIENAAQQLLGMVNDLLDLARLEAGKYEPELETLSSAEVAEMLDEVGTLLAPLAEQKRVLLQVSEEVPDGAVVTDRRFLRQVILNLISNAIKFTDRGSIACWVEKMEGGLCLAVEDTGRGMSSDTLKRVFEPFVQSEEEDRERGSGLGLALSRRFARLSGAELTLSSEGAGKGSTARLCFTTL
ncbi:MAG: ATP-binding protein [Campylobacterales bacterium]